MSDPQDLKLIAEDTHGKKWTIPVDGNWIRQHLGICDIKNDVEMLESKVDDLEIPMRKARIIAWLKEEGKPRSTNWCERHIPEFRWEDAWQLIKEEKLKTFYSGKTPMLQVADP